ncbi:uncharacterized protein C8A04DRAFT_40599 [Dichotomopilus funicola]|uniref:FAD-binding domain-containing protein n=1 Tax=Dichotomopilus funicola TaxID=1934379 RepID=A0AAN6UUR3_9PEZI|nr:hypothetical protein C8A04DRAFT_40599 [Dichotomopilus funicola]
MSDRIHFLSGRHIVVAGGGIAGLSFAVALRKLWPPQVPPPKLTILERDSKEDALGRAGYSLSLAGYDETGGLVALRDLGLLDTILKHAILGTQDGSTGASFKAWNPDWTELLSVRFKPAPGLPTSSIRIARKNLRKTLIDAVPDEVRWESTCLSATKTKNGRVSLRISGGNGGKPESTVECDLLVVADGASSKVRASLRPDDQLEYAGAVQLIGQASFPNGIPPPLDRNWGQQLSGGHGVACFYSPVDSHSVVWGLSYVDPTFRPKVGPFRSREEILPVLEEARRRGHMLGPRFLEVLDATEDPTSVLVSPARDKKPFAHNPSELGPVVFIGDSNHAVSPFAGYGASLALKDGWDLAEKVIQASSVDSAIRNYDAVSVPRAVKVLQTSRTRIKHGHSTGVSYFLFRTFLSVMGYLLWLSGRA